jgi:DNA polymerase-3 subunit beta
MKEMIRKTQFSASIDESKGIIVGVLMELEESSLNMVALDGFRMAVTRESMINERRDKIIISAKIMNEIAKILSETNEESDENIDFILSDKKAVMLLEGTKIVMRLLEGEFINYKDILPKESGTVIKVSRSSMIEAIERASLLAKEGRNNLIRINIQENLMNISSASEEGSVNEDIIMEKTGNDLEIGFNSKYVMDALKVIEDEEIKIELNTAVKPCLIKPVEGNRFEYLILPVRIPSN